MTIGRHAGSTPSPTTPWATTTRSGSCPDARRGGVSPREVVDAAVARTEPVAAGAHTGSLPGRSTGARAEARDPRRRLLRRRPHLRQGQRRRRRDADPARLASLRGARRPSATATSPAMFLATGLVPLGKTQLSEFGFSASAEFPDDAPVRNPWHTDHSSGASSAGSAAFVAAGAVPSRTPTTAAARSGSRPPCNGLVGLKPTRGRMPQRQDDARDAGEDRGATAWSRARCATPPSSTARRRRSTATSSCRRSATSAVRRGGACASRWSRSRSRAGRPTRSASTRWRTSRSCWSARDTTSSWPRRPSRTPSSPTSASTGRCSRGT